MAKRGRGRGRKKKRWCAWCHHKRGNSRHHIYPRQAARLNGEEVANEVRDLCRRCHDLIHEHVTNEELAQMTFRQSVRLVQRRMILQRSGA